jgi:hypothetical protein
MALGAELTRSRLEAAVRAAEAEPVHPEPLTPLVDSATAAEELECSEPAATTYEQYARELLELLESPWGRTTRGRFENYPFLVTFACRSRSILSASCSCCQVWLYSKTIAVSTCP